ncbi:hypothetical protein L596_013608 [Steinernema carpocapsae]|uniref:Uncharacterized protein n=1 Tax=Steinernema carpocapsae TaxID=34508 RepID=A0A4V6A551_STECR|nr:hypothetical protein L596_013608 [Steinernema carpocapsae]
MVINPHDPFPVENLNQIKIRFTRTGHQGCSSTSEIGFFFDVISSVKSTTSLASTTWSNRASQSSSTVGTSNWMSSKPTATFKESSSSSRSSFNAVTKTTSQSKTSTELTSHKDAPNTSAAVTTTKNRSSSLGCSSMTDDTLVMVCLAAIVQFYGH